MGLGVGMGGFRDQGVELEGVGSIQPHPLDLVFCSLRTISFSKQIKNTLLIG